MSRPEARRTQGPGEGVDGDAGALVASREAEPFGPSDESSSPSSADQSAPPGLPCGSKRSSLSLRGEVFYLEMRKRSSASAPEVRVSTADLRFKTVPGVDYARLDCVLASPAANDQLLMVMSTQCCSESLFFLNALARMRACGDAQDRWTQLNDLFEQYIDADVPNSVNILGPTRIALFDELAVGAHSFEPDAPGDRLLDMAESEIKRLMSGALRELERHCEAETQASPLEAGSLDQRQHFLPGTNEIKGDR